MSMSEITRAVDGYSKSMGGLNVIDIKKILSENGLSSSGTRSDLIERLKALVEPVQDVQQKSEVLSIDDLPRDPTRKIYYLQPDFLKTMAGLLTSTDYELGGMIDLKSNGDFDRNIYSIGGKTSVDISDFDDYEISYHSHPFHPSVYYNIPSHDDIMHAVWRSSKGLFQIDILFTFDGIYVTYISGKPKLSIERIRELYIEHGIMGENNNLLIESMRDPSILNLFNSLAPYGVYILRYSTVVGKPSSNPMENWPEQIPIYINPTEPNIHLNTRVDYRNSDHIPSVLNRAGVTPSQAPERDSVIEYEMVPPKHTSKKSKQKWFRWHKGR
jgi:hypothetical protein